MSTVLASSAVETHHTREDERVGQLKYSKNMTVNIV